jgi:fimbrial chaperone protein
VALLPRSAALADDGIGIQPTIVQIDAAHRIATVTIANHDPDLHTFQITPYSWSQVDGQDKLTPTTDLLVSPPIFTLISEGEQVVRFALRNPAPVAGELAFRIALRTAPTDTLPLHFGVQMRLSFNLPVFIASPQGGATASPPGGAPKLTCTYRDLGHNRVRLTVENSGLAHVRVVHVQLADAHGTPVDAPSARYVLSGARATVDLSASRPPIGETIDAKITLDQGQGPAVDVVAHRDG